jgi:hypothetical protein
MSAPRSGCRMYRCRDQQRRSACSHAPLTSHVAPAGAIRHHPRRVMRRRTWVHRENTEARSRLWANSTRICRDPPPQQRPAHQRADREDASRPPETHGVAAHERLLDQRCARMRRFDRFAAFLPRGLPGRWAVVHTLTGTTDHRPALRGRLLLVQRTIDPHYVVGSRRINRAIRDITGTVRRRREPKLFRSIALNEAPVHDDAFRNGSDA